MVYFRLKFQRAARGEAILHFGPEGCTDLLFLAAHSALFGWDWLLKSILMKCNIPLEMSHSGSFFRWYFYSEEGTGMSLVMMF